MFEEMIRETFVKQQEAFVAHINEEAKEAFEMAAHNWAANATRVSLPKPVAPLKVAVTFDLGTSLSAKIFPVNMPVSNLDPATLVETPGPIALGPEMPGFPGRFFIVGGTQNTIGEEYLFGGVKYVIKGGFFGLQAWFEKA